VRICLFQFEFPQVDILPKFAYDSFKSLFKFTPQYISLSPTMASRVRNVTCRACAKNFTQTGFQSHLRQTKDPHCAALFAEIVNTGMELDDHEHQPFEGDVFGGHDDYIDDDFGQLQDEDEQPEEEQANLENGWEPERPGARAASFQTNEDQTNEDPPIQQAGDHDEPIINTRSQAEGRIADSHIVVRYSDKYPDHQAGAPLKKTQPGDDNYRAALDNSSNPWAPFSSQMDWEIANWAKLRGAGSTAFSDLLAIKGVSKSCGSACRAIFHTDINNFFKGSRSAQFII
jgi:phage FluMu protein Com